MNCENKSPLPILRSPSHESINTNLSLFSVSSIELKTAKLARGPSPNPSDTKVQIQEPERTSSFFEEDFDLLKTCAQLSAALGLRKSFSSSELSIHNNNNTSVTDLSLIKPRNAVSEMILCCQKHFEIINTNSRLQNISRSCSTWVAIGDIQSNSQLPSPHNNFGNNNNSNFTPADLIRSVNKKVRQNYIQKRLLTTCKALERLSKSDFNLDEIEHLVSQQPTITQTSSTSTAVASVSGNHLKVPGSEVRRKSKNLPLTIRDIEKEKGKPLSKYERNIMIFNWLHTLEDTDLESLQ